MAQKKVLLKIIILGDSGVGKTCLLNRYVDNKFSQEYRATIGADFSTKEIEISDKLITLQIWDTAGMERFQSLGTAFYRGSDAALIVYDITDLNTFKKVDQWKNSFINEASPEDVDDFPFLLLGNKSDLNQSRQVQLEDAQRYAKANNMEFFETSALDGSNVQKAIQSITAIASEKGSAPFFTTEVDNVLNDDIDDDQAIQTTNNDAGGCGCQII